MGRCNRRGGAAGARAPDTRAEERKHLGGQSVFDPGEDMDGFGDQIV